jgi:hypothetical protein
VQQQPDIPALPSCAHHPPPRGVYGVPYFVFGQPAVCGNTEGGQQRLLVWVKYPELEAAYRAAAGVALTMIEAAEAEYLASLPRHNLMRRVK